MKTKKKAYAMLGLFVGALALTGCNGATEDTKGNILTYVDADGNVVGYTAEELLWNYQANGTALSTEFDRIYEVLIRKYYSQESQSAEYNNILNNATNAVKSDQETAQSNATANGTSYETEMQTILDSHSVDNLDELLEYYIYNGTSEFPGEKDTFEDNFYADNVEAMRDGSTQGLDHASDDPLFPSSEEYGIGNSGWLKEEIPYHVRHVLINVSATYSNFVNGEITMDDGIKLSNAIFAMAGVNYIADTNNYESLGTLTPVSGSSRQSFGQIALQYSDDTTSAVNYGDLGLMADSYVNEFRLGVYAYESLYNEEVKTSPYWQANVAQITPGLKKDATSQSDVDDEQTVGMAENSPTVNEYFNDLGIGTIPFGAVVALARTSATSAWERDSNNLPVNDNIATTYPRNIIFNKYFNKHNVCVITPNEIAFNDQTGQISADSEEGVYSQDYGALPGFSTYDTTNVLPQFQNNVLTNSEGQIILAVRAGTSDYTGIHFIVIQRDGLSQYGSSLVEGSYKMNTAKTDGVADLSEYYTLYTTNESNYPKSSSGNDLTTYVNYNTQAVTGGDNNQTSRVSTIRDEIEGYSDAISTYIFQDLIEGDGTEGKIEFTNSRIESDMQRYIRLRRTSAVDEEFETFKDAWLSYAELLTAQESARTFGYIVDDQGNVRAPTSAEASENNPRLVPERCAIGFKGDKTSNADWQEGGVCYYVNN